MNRKELIFDSYKHQDRENNNKICITLKISAHAEEVYVKLFEANDCTLDT
jgi:hypothetical protein